MFHGISCFTRFYQTFIILFAINPIATSINLLIDVSCLTTFVLIIYNIQRLRRNCKTLIMISIGPINDLIHQSMHVSNHQQMQTKKKFVEFKIYRDFL